MPHRITQNWRSGKAIRWNKIAGDLSLSGSQKKKKKKREREREVRGVRKRQRWRQNGERHRQTDKKTE